MVERFARVFLEDDDRLALVGDAQAQQIVFRLGIIRQQGVDRAQGVVVDFLRVVLDPTRLRIVLLVIQRRLVEQAAIRREQQGFGRGGALINGQDRGHAMSNLVLSRES